MNETVLKATHEGELKIGNLIIPCAVLEDGSRVLTQAGFLRAMGRSQRPPAGQGASVEQAPPFLAAKNLKPFISEGLVRSSAPIRFKPLTSGGLRGVQFGFKGELFPLVWELSI